MKLKEEDSGSLISTCCPALNPTKYTPFWEEVYSIHSSHSYGKIVNGQYLAKILRQYLVRIETAYNSSWQTSSRDKLKFWLDDTKAIKDSLRQLLC